MTSEEKMREEFEAWHKAVYSYLPRYDIAHDYYLESECDDRYDVWKASRESLVIELPLKGKDMAWMDDYDSGCVYGRNAAIESCKYAIHAAGVKTK